jgi:hypothetical protein
MFIQSTEKVQNKTFKSFLGLSTYDFQCMKYSLRNPPPPPRHFTNPLAWHVLPVQNTWPVGTQQNLYDVT